MQQYKTINTFTQRPSIPQIIAILVFCGQVILFAGIIQKRYQDKQDKIGMIVVYSFVIVGHFVATLITACNDPSDQFMIRYRNRDAQVQNEAKNYSLYCDLCKSYVNNGSKHCSICNRCTEGFDHHCVWINNCIGRKNYRIFLVMLSFTFINMIIYLVCIILLWCQGKYLEFIGEMIVLWVSGIVIVVFVVLVANLIGFHIYLCWVCMTTYDFLKKKKKVKENVSDSFQHIRQQPLNKIFPKHEQQSPGKQGESKQGDQQPIQYQQQDYKQNNNSQGQQDKDNSECQQQKQIYPWRQNSQKKSKMEKRSIKDERKKILIENKNEEEGDKVLNISQYLNKGIKMLRDSNVKILQPRKCRSVKNVRYGQKPNALTLTSVL